MKVPKARELSSGTWFIQLRLGGESIPITGRTEPECISKAQFVKARYLLEREPSNVPQELTLGQMLDNYIKKKKVSASPSTIRGYSIIRRNRLQDYMDKPIKSIKNWQALYDSEADDYSAKTMFNEWSLIRSAYKYATGKDFPHIEEKPLVKKEHEFLEPDEIKKYVASVVGTKAAIPALLALHSLRASELADLEWKDIDFEKETIFINGSAVFDENNKLIHKETNKTKLSRRYVPFLIPELKEALLEARQEEGYVVPVMPNTVYRWLNESYIKAGVTPVGVHGLRHSFASLCYSLEMPIKITMTIGGWSNYQTVLDIYTHLDKKNVGKHVDKLKQFYAEKEPGNIPGIS